MTTFEIEDDDSPKYGTTNAYCSICNAVKSHRYIEGELVCVDHRNH